MKESSECIVKLSRSQFSIATGNIYKAAVILTSLMEDYKFFMSPIPFAIFSGLKMIFDSADLYSIELNSILKKFNPNITFHIAFASATNDDLKAINYSLTLLNELLGGKILTKRDDRISISLA